MQLNNVLKALGASPGQFRRRRQHAGSNCDFKFEKVRNSVFRMDCEETVKTPLGVSFVPCRCVGLSEVLYIARILPCAESGMVGRPWQRHDRGQQRRREHRSLEHTTSLYTITLQQIFIRFNQLIDPKFLVVCSEFQAWSSAVPAST